MNLEALPLQELPEKTHQVFLIFYDQHPDAHRSRPVGEDSGTLPAARCGALTTLPLPGRDAS
jgi:hypothetical protein